MTIKFYKPRPQDNAQTWLFVTDNSVYEMSENALDPNGVNMYCCTPEELRSDFVATYADRHYSIRSVPPHILGAALLRLEQENQ